MPPHDDELPHVYLRPGEFFLAREPTVIRTILGSCVGITFWSARLRIGALCHSMLPRAPTNLFDSGSEINLAEGRRYVDFCIHDLARQFDELGVPRTQVRVKLFGGADVLAVANPCAKPTVGRQNADTALHILAEEGYTIEAKSLGDVFGRKIRFNTGNGDVLVRKLI
jgi:chemotaxis protein CheD